MKLKLCYIIIFGILNKLNLVDSASLLGIDFGSEYIKVSIVSPGKGFNILLNNQSKRKITNALSFGSKVRTYDEEAKIYSGKNPQLTILNSNNLLAYNLFESLKNKENYNIENFGDDNEAFFSDINNYNFEKAEDNNGVSSDKYFSYDYVVDHKRGTIYLKMKDNMVLSSEEITANILGYIKKLAYNHLNIDYKNKRNVNVNIGCVISVPCNFPQRKKEALLNASKIAGLELIGIINGVTAAAIHNANDLALNTTKLTMYLDVGSNNINVGIASVSYVENNKVRTRTINMHACEVLENNSGTKVDILLSEYLRKKFEEKFNVNIENDKKAMRKLLTASNKAKLLLSAKKSTDVFIESLYNNKSLQETVTRQEFEDLIHDVIMKFKIPINNALQKASFELKDIEALELIGSSWRIPKVLNEITNFFDPLKVGMHLNSDEAITMGAIYIAAYNSANYRLRGLEYTDIISNEYRILVHKEEGEDTDEDSTKNEPKELIPYFSKYPVNKVVILKYRKNLQFSIYENGKMISKYILGPTDVEIKHVEHLDEAKIHIKFSLDKFGILNVENVYLVYEEEKVEEKTEEKVEEKTEEKVEEKTEEKVEEKTEEKPEERTEEKPEERTEEKKKSIIKHKIALSYETKYIKPVPLTAEEVKEKKEILKKFDDHDINVFLKSERKNKLESFIYETRSKMKQDSYKQVCREDDLKQYLDKLEDYEEWLYIEKDEPLENVNNKIKDLEDIYLPIKERAEEYELRGPLIKQIDEKIKDTKEKLLGYYETKPWAEQTLKMISSSLEETIKWWNNAKEEQSKLDNYSAPYFKAKDVELRFSAINALVKNVEKIKHLVDQKEKAQKGNNSNNTANKETENKTEEGNDSGKDNKADTSEENQNKSEDNLKTEQTSEEKGKEEEKKSDTLEQTDEL
ncbi:heat shock protein 110, putative [Plasmodium berghei]|uniref:Heat shock protein 110, putative n=1 Tax=Plasmodium berghei TaxID=5821 RepID=A0A0Y9ZYD5_PLABE|nr:heat shock protein 110, putative [Plasmodium berghei]SCM18643.1 heat shock protein 110, putative [Plasmodium berghei]